MLGLSSILKGLGVNVDSEHLKAVEELIPKIPGKVNEIILFISNVSKRYDTRLDRIEKTQLLILNHLGVSTNGTNGSNDNNRAITGDNGGSPTSDGRSNTSN